MPVNSPHIQPPLNMKIAVSSICWASTPLPEVCRKAAAAGFTHLEPLLFPREIFPLHGDLREMSDDYLLKIVRESGLELAALHIAALWTRTPEMTRVLTAYMKRAIDCAASTGCGLVVVGGPERQGSQPFKPFLLAMEREILPYLDQHPGVRIALENHWRNWIESIADYEHIFDWLDHPRLGMTLDTGHFTSAGIDPESVARQFGSRVFHVHIKDHKGIHSVGLGEGETNNFGTVRFLKSLGYEGFISQEIETHGPDPDRLAAEGIHYMKQLLEA